MCHIVSVTLIRYKPLPGQSIFDFVVFAAKKAFISGEYLPGQEFPSVRALAANLKIHPNTAHKIVHHLIQERWLEARPGIGTIVAAPPEARVGDKSRLLAQEVEQLVVEAKRVGLEFDEVVTVIAEHWVSIGRTRKGGEQ
jgi:GntR family transcriptional regulator